MVTVKITSYRKIYLYDSELDFAVRGSGCGSASAEDAILSTQAFDDITFDATNKSVDIGAGLNWGRVDSKLADLAPGYVVDPSQESLYGRGGEPELAVIIFDANGETHARQNDSGFKWALEIEGAKEKTQEMDLRAVNELGNIVKGSHGIARSWLEAALIDDECIDENILVRCLEWYEYITKGFPFLELGTFMLLEIMQEPSFASAGSLGATAWPRAGKGRKHVLKLSVGAPPAGEGEAEDFENLKKTALAALADAPSRIAGRSSHPPGDFLPNFLLENNDPSEVFGANWGKLRQLKRKHDERGRFNKGYFIPPAVSE